MRESPCRAEAHRESSNGALLRAELSSACPVQPPSRSPARKRVFLASAVVLAMTALFLAAIVTNDQVSYEIFVDFLRFASGCLPQRLTPHVQGSRFGAKRASRSFLSMAQSYSKQKLAQQDSEGPATYCLNGNGYVKPLLGTIEVSRVDGLDDNDYYYLSIQGTTGHHLTAIIEVGKGYNSHRLYIASYCTCLGIGRIPENVGQLWKHLGWSDSQAENPRPRCCRLSAGYLGSLYCWRRVTDFLRR